MSLLAYVRIKNLNVHISNSRRTYVGNRHNDSYFTSEIAQKGDKSDKKKNDKVDVCVTRSLFIVACATIRMWIHQHVTNVFNCDRNMAFASVDRVHSSKW